MSFTESHSPILNSQISHHSKLYAVVKRRPHPLWSHRRSDRRFSFAFADAFESPEEGEIGADDDDEVEG